MLHWNGNVDCLFRHVCQQLRYGHHIGPQPWRWGGAQLLLHIAVMMTAQRRFQHITWYHFGARESATTMMTKTNPYVINHDNTASQQTQNTMITPSLRQYYVITLLSASVDVLLLPAEIGLPFDPITRDPDSFPASKSRSFITANPQRWILIPVHFPEQNQSCMADPAGRGHFHAMQTNVQMRCYYDSRHAGDKWLH